MGFDRVGGEFDGAYSSNIQSPGVRSVGGLARKLALGDRWGGSRPTSATHNFSKAVKSARDAESSIGSLRVSAFHNLKDASVGIWHGLLRLDRTSDVVLSYKTKLWLRTWPPISRFLHLLKFADDAKGELEQSQRRLAESKIAIASNELSRLDQSSKEIEAEEKLALDPDALQMAKAEYSKWLSAVGRPPFSEKFDTTPLASSNNDASAVTDDDPNQGNEKISIFERFRRALPSWLKAYIYIAAPIEVAFTAPAFEEILQSTHAIAIAAATVFTGALMLLGHAAGVYSSHAVEHSISSAGHLTTRMRVISCIAAISLLLVGLFGAAMGAAFRSVLPDAVESRATLADIESRERRLLDPSNLLMAPEERQEKLREISALRDRYNETHHKMLRKGFGEFLFTVDGRMSLFVYLSLLLGMAIKARLSRDPILEYEVVAVHYSSSRRAAASDLHSLRRTLSNIRERRAAIDAEIGQLQSGVYTTFLDLVEMEDRLREVDEFTQQATTNCRVHEESIQLYLRARAQTYFNYYCMTRIGGLSAGKLRRMSSSLRADFKPNSSYL